MLYRTLVLTSLLLLTSCGLLPSGSSESGLNVPLIAAQATPADVVSRFLEAWNAKDYTTMFSLLSAESRSRFDLPIFEQIYTKADTALSLTSLSYTITNTTLQGQSAAVQYDVTLQSPVFDSITDSGRTMRLIQQAGGWGIAWSSMDIFDGLTTSSSLQVTTRRAPRGQILDRNGQPLVAVAGTIIPVYGRRMDMNGEAECLTLLADVLMRQRYDLVNEFSIYAADTVFFMGAIDSATEAARGQEIRDICGANIATDFAADVRHYVLGRGSVHVLGYVGAIPAEQLETYRQRGYSSGELVGLSGVEQAYERELAGQADQILQIVAPNGLVLRELASKAGSPPVDVRLTLDINLQRATAKALSDAFNTAEMNWAAPGISTGAGMVAISVKTGEILAIASYPAYDPYAFIPDSPIPDKGIVISRFFNDTVRQPTLFRPVTEQYFPGSTFKIITLSAALNEAVMPESTFYCDLIWDGSAKYGDTASPRSDWRRWEPEDSPVSMAAGDLASWQALAASCNPFFYEMGARLYLQRGPDTLVEYARKMGLGGVTGLAGFREAAGALPDPSGVEGGINEAIGQGGIQVSILQMARMVAGVANGGTLYKPYLVQQIGDGSVAQPLAVANNGIREDVLATVRRGMCAVTTDTTYGTAWFDFEGINYTVCAKTGTAQSGRREPYGWFVAYAPADDPQIALAGMVEFSREGSETAAPIIRRMLDAYFQQEPAPYPEWWWMYEYVPLQIPTNETGG